MRKDKLLKVIKEIFQLNNEEQAKNKIKEMDFLVEEVFKRMDDEETTKIGEYFTLETGSTKGREGYTNPRTKVKSDIPPKKFKKIKQTKKVNEI